MIGTQSLCQWKPKLISTFSSMSITASDATVGASYVSYTFKFTNLFNLNSL